MNSRNSRFDPRKVLDSDWRRQVWKRWLRSTLADAAESQEGPLESQAGADQDPARAVENDGAEVVVPSNAAAAAAQSTTATAERPAVVESAVVESAVARGAVVESAPEREQSARRNELRARFDALFDRIASIDDTLDALGKRFTLNSAHARRQEQRLFERIENSAETLERQTLALEAMQAQVEQIDLRLARLENRARHQDRDSAWSDQRDANVASSATLDDADFSDLEQAFAEEARSVARLMPPDPNEPPPFSSSSIHGNLSEMSLPTVLAMLELERHTGLLKVRSEDGRIVTAALRNGSIVGAKRSEVDADPVDVVREALRYSKGHFWFRQSGVEVVSGPTRSVGSILLEASSRNDEAARTG